MFLLSRFALMASCPETVMLSSWHYIIVHNSYVKKEILWNQQITLIENINNHSGDLNPQLFILSCLLNFYLFLICKIWLIVLCCSAAFACLVNLLVLRLKKVNLLVFAVFNPPLFYPCFVRTFPIEK